MDNQKLKVFLSYHKNTPCYQSEVFQPIFVGAENNPSKLDFAIPDNSGENISKLNPYFCELTGHYWVLKNYIDTCDDEYIGFGHYRRLPDIMNISDTDTPSIFGCTYSESKKLFDRLNKEDLIKYCKPYDVLLPCSVYLYANTVNPVLRENEPHYDMYNQFIVQHNSDLPDKLKIVIDTYYPDYSESLMKSFKKEKAHCFNMYIMKKQILQSFLIWEFDVLKKIGNLINGWEQEKYIRLAGFVGEQLINIWLEKNNNYGIGYFPVMMVDFESDYIIEANRLHETGDYSGELNVLKQFYEIASDKFSVASAIIQLSEIINQQDESKKYLKEAEKYAKTSDDYVFLARSYSKKGDTEMSVKLYIKAIDLTPADKYFADIFLNYANSLRNLEILKTAWSYKCRFELSQKEKENYEHFKKVCDMADIK